MYQFNLSATKSYMEVLPAAVVTTLLLSGLAILASIFVGIAGALCRTSNVRVLRFIGGAYVELLRNIPLLIVIYLVYFGLAQLGLRISGFTSALIALTLNAGAYMTEMIRGGLAAIGKGQFEAARSQAMTAPQIYRYIVMPQVFRIIYAPFGNLCIGIVLGSALASIVGVEDVTSWMHTVGSNSFRYLEAFLMAGAIYLALAQTINLLRIGTGRWLLSHSPSATRQ
ncbi:MAG: amino acid ABC transporter permease [Alphaproteobacteria bacterium]|nr:amino acid ABC transporter permease [Alphaproteobacteria bacterium]